MNLNVEKFTFYFVRIFLFNIHNKSPIFNIYIFIVIALDETSILVAVQLSIQNIYESCDLGRAFWRSNVDGHQ